MTYAPADLAKKLTGLSKQFDKDRQNALRRVLRRARTEWSKQLRSRGVGRALWSKKKGTATMLIKVDRVKKVGESLTSGIEAKGMAAMIDQGGRTKAHVIKPKNMSVLRLKLPNGFGFARQVNHPGSTLAAQGHSRAAQAYINEHLPAELELVHRKVIAAEIG